MNETKKSPYGDEGNKKPKDDDLYKKSFGEIVTDIIQYIFYAAIVAGFIYRIMK